jgi:hypothetical protein
VSFDVVSDTIERCKKLFGYSHMEAVRLIGDQRGDRKSNHELV